MNKLENKKQSKTREMLPWLLIGILLISYVGTIVTFREQYQAAIQAGAKNTVTALEMTVACESAGNVTKEQMMDEYYRLFIRPKFNSTIIK